MPDPDDGPPEGWHEVARTQRSHIHATTWVAVPGDGEDQSLFLSAGPLRRVQRAIVREYGHDLTVYGWHRDGPDCWLLVAPDA